MTLEHTPDQTAVDRTATPAAPDTNTGTAPAEAAAPGKTGTPTFKSLFANAASAADKGQPRHRNGNNFLYNERIGPAPRGSRRSMGKR